MKSIRFVLSVVFLLANATVNAVIHVPGDQSTIQAAINSAASGDTIVVAAGTYTGSGNWDINPGNKSLLVRSESGPMATIIDCGAGLGQTHAAFHVSVGQIVNLTLEGVSIQGSSDYEFLLESDSASLTLRNCRFVSFPANGRSVIHALGAASLTMVGCVIEGQPQRSYLAVRNIDIDSCEFRNCTQEGPLEIRLSPACSIRNSVFRDNSSYLGGAMAMSQSNVSIDSCLFADNLAHSGDGGALFVVVSQVDISRSEFRGNHGLVSGAIGLNAESSGRLAGCLFTSNTSENYAGAIFVSFSSTLEMDNCTLYGNSGSSPFGDPSAQVYLQSPDTGAPTAIIRNSIIAFAGDGRAAVCYDQSELDIADYMIFECSNVFGNAGGDFTGTLATTYPMFDNVSVDPQFVDTAAGDFSYQPGSPMLPEFSPCSLLIGASGFEPPPSCCSGIRGNINGDSQEQIDIADVTFMVNYMFRSGAVPPCAIEADLNGDSSVDIADLTTLVSYSFKQGPSPTVCP